MKRDGEKIEETVIRQDAALHRAGELLEKIFSGVHFLLAYLDADFRFVRVNRAYAAAYGRPPEYFTGRDLFSLFPGRANRRIFRRVVLSGRPFVAFARPYLPPGRPAGETTYWDWSLRPVKTADGRVEGVLLIQIDVTEQKRSEDRLDRSRKKMADMERLAELGTLSSMVAHEIRTPLAAIGLAAGNLRRKTSDPSLLKNIRTIEEKVKFGNRVISNLLEYARLRLPAYRKFNLLPLARSALRTSLRSHRDRRVEVTADLAELRRKKMEADPDQVGEVLTNLLDNAIEAAPEGDGRIGFSARIEDGRTVVLEIRNNGPPIFPEVLKEVFTPFFTSKPEGTGLGLPICRELVRLHDGSLDLKNEPGRGIVAVLRLPLLAHQ